jgi:hypothetical protein
MHIAHPPSELTTKTDAPSARCGVFLANMMTGSLARRLNHGRLTMT